MFIKLYFMHILLISDTPPAVTVMSRCLWCMRGANSCPVVQLGGTKVFLAAQIHIGDTRLEHLEYYQKSPQERDPYSDRLSKQHLWNPETNNSNTFFVSMEILSVASGSPFPWHCCTTCGHEKHTSRLGRPT
jgi:hypothetical protein